MNKQMRTLIIIAFVALLFPLQVSSQAFRSVDEDVTIVVKNPETDEVVFTFSSGLERILITPSGNFLRTVTFTIDDQNPIMNFSGPVRILEVKMFYDIDGDGNDEEISDTMAVLTRSGKLKLVYHSNGAGKRLPPGWDFE